jgi:hypothetical protein
VYYRIKRFFSGVHACVNGADVITNWINVHVWTPSLWVHRHRLHMYELLKRTVYYLQFFHVNLFPILIIKLISDLLSIGHYRSFPPAAAILCMLVIQQTFNELWTDQKRKSSSSYERIKNKQVTVLLSNQKARKRYKLIL